MAVYTIFDDSGSENRYRKISRSDSSIAGSFVDEIFRDQRIRLRVVELDVATSQGGRGLRWGFESMSRSPSNSNTL